MGDLCLYCFRLIIYCVITITDESDQCLHCENAFALEYFEIVLFSDSDCKSTRAWS